MSPTDRRTLDAQNDASARDTTDDLTYRPSPLAPPRYFYEGGTAASQRDDTYYQPLSYSRQPSHVHRARGRRHGAPAQPPPTPAVPSPFVRPGLWDTLVIAGIMFLGLVKITGATGTKLAKKKHNGRDGGRVTDKGAIAAEFQILFRFWDRETWASFDQVFAAIDPQRPVDQRAPVDVSHPVLAQRRITRIYVEKVSFPERQADGEWHVTADVVQWLPSSPDRAGASVTRTRAAPLTLSNTSTAFTGLSSTTDEGVADPAETDSAP